MKDSKWLWRWVSLISITATAILLAGFVYAVQDIVNPVGTVTPTTLPQETSATQEAGTGKLNLVALGDSLAKGTGDNSGQGFVRRTVAGLSDAGVSSELLINMGINGQTAAGLQSRLDDEGMQYAIRQADVVLLSIGGNDLFRGAQQMQSGAAADTPAPGTQPAVGAEPAEGEGATKGTGNAAQAPASGGVPEISPESVLAALPEASAKLGTILERISEINPQAQIYYMGLYNPFGDISELLEPGNQAVTAWNNAAMDIINRHGNMTLVPTFDLFNRHLDKYLSTDHFHPNGEGYQRMADRVVQALR
ncbi:GDSL-type esterase/lipase family protein [Paenibacillus donghaensis]|uniref:Lysophospholipase n=1 Tax=Paenibacillus donghaensis TaxID=414771 RepID=A0A2Z2KTA0_9BACL|nr:GDSL-type esterase/lipase family protein [Paenibacillus donghaensis]ASA26389.1 lysophospholipase [Paenibacillus donghaensis]